MGISTPADPGEITLYRGLDSLPPSSWEDLAALEPGRVSRRAGVVYRSGEGYVAPFLDVDHLIDFKARRINVPAGARPPGFQAGLVLINYLIHASDQDLSGRMVTARELEGGELFFQGPHALNKAPVLKRYARDGAGMLAKGRSWGGAAFDSGDAAFRLLALPKILVAYTLYEEDEEFPARLTITFDAHTDRHLPLDGIWALINVISSRLAQD